MRTVQETLRIITTKALSLSKEKISILNSTNRVLAENIYANVDVPSFNQSAVDGFAIASDNYSPDKEFLIIGEIKAGDSKVKYFSTKMTQSNSVIKIYTGALVPNEYDAVIMKEYAQENNGIVKFSMGSIKSHQNIRHKGEEVKKGELIFQKYTLIRPEHIAVLASLGKKQVSVLKKPEVKIIATGNELKKITISSLLPGEKYETNGLMLQHLLKKYFDIDAEYSIVRDKKSAIYQQMNKAIQKHDIVITTGGVSVGDYDYTKEIIKKLGFKILIDKVAQKPGKPFVFAVKDKKVIFGLPGNPRAALSCFYWYIVRYLLKSMRQELDWINPVVQVKLHQDIVINDNKTRFLFAQVGNNNDLFIPEKQDSHMLISAAKCNALVAIEKSFKEGETVNAYLL
ncbi:MAG: molybdopterin molybdotransferase MoeA [Bacteroidia bacterium]|nr:MAG: molybdopterin molybdotransferase MoeA [Bacteroidia bacterium]